MKRIIIYFLLLISFAVITNGCGTTKKTSSATGKISEQDRINATYSYFNAVKEKLTGNQGKAAELFATCLHTDPGNHAAMYELASIYNDQRKYADALFFAKSASELNPSNEWYSMLLADTYEKTGKPEEAAGIYQKLTKQYPDKIEYSFNLADAYLYQQKYPEAIKVYDQIEQKVGVSMELTQQKQRLYLKENKIPEAAAEVEKLIKSDPDNIEYYSMLVDLYQANNMNEKALETIKRMQVIDPENPIVALSMAEYYRANGKKSDSFEELKKAFRAPQLASAVKIKILTSYLPLVNQSDEMMSQALELSTILSTTHPTDANAQAVYGDFLSLDKKYDDARKQYRQSLVIDKKNLQAWQQLLLAESDLSDFVAMESESDEALSLFPDQSVLYLFNGISKMQNKKYEEAAKSLLSGSKMVVDNNPQLMEFYSNLGDVYNRLKKFDDSDKYFDKALVLDPSNVLVLNNYAYYLTLRNEKLDKAAEMSKKSNDIRVNDATFEDTYAWVFYKQGKFEDAKTWLDKALANGGDKSGAILEHYGDVLFKLGKTEEAISYWQKAKKAGDYSELLDKKIAEKKIYE